MVKLYVIREIVSHTGGTINENGGYVWDWKGETTDWGNSRTYDQIKLVFGVNMSEFAKNYADWYLEAVEMVAWGRNWDGPNERNLGIAAHYSTDMRVYGSEPNNLGVRASKANPVKFISDVIKYWPGKNGDHETTRTLTLTEEIKMGDYLNRPVPFMQYNTYGSTWSGRNIIVKKLSMYKYLEGFPGWGSDVLRSWLGKSSGHLSELGTGWMSDVQSKKIQWKPEVILPLKVSSYDRIGGRGSGIPGDLWGGGRIRMKYEVAHDRTIVAIQLRMQIRKYQGSSQGSNGIFITNKEHHETPAYGTGVSFTKWLACEYGPDEDIIFEARGNGSQGEGKTYDELWVASVRYSDGTEETMGGVPPNGGR